MDALQQMVLYRLTWAFCSRFSPIASTSQTRHFDWRLMAGLWDWNEGFTLQMPTAETSRGNLSPTNSTVLRMSLWVGRCAIMDLYQNASISFNPSPPSTLAISAIHWVTITIRTVQRSISLSVFRCREAEMCGTSLHRQRKHFATILIITAVRLKSGACGLTYW